MIGKTPKWAESRFTPDNLLHAVECCMADGPRCYDCPLKPWDECQNILLTHLAKKLGVEKK